jgi:hypothetical protein
MRVLRMSLKRRCARRLEGTDYQTRVLSIGSRCRRGQDLSSWGRGDENGPQYGRTLGRYRADLGPASPVLNVYSEEAASRRHQQESGHILITCVWD